MSESWKIVRAEEVQIGDVVRTSTGDVLTVARIETSFLDLPNLIAFIEDTPDRWYKCPVTVDADVEILTSTD
jgi:hypothetical protein